MNRITRAAAMGWIVVGSMCFAQEKSVLRDWQDATATHSAKARFIRVEGDTVFLEKEDGTRVKVPLNKLSKSDQGFVAKQQVANPFTRPSISTGEVEKVSVLVWVEKNGHSIPRSGYVFFRDKSRAFVFYQNAARSFPRSARLSPIQRRVSIYNGDESAIDMTGELVNPMTLTSGLQIFAVSNEHLPTSLLEMPISIPKVGDAVIVTGFEAVAASAARVEWDAKITKLFRNQSGALTLLEIETDGDTALPFCVVTDSQGRLVGVTGSSRKGSFTTAVLPRQTLIDQNQSMILSAKGEIQSTSETMFTLDVHGSLFPLLKNTTPRVVIHSPNDTAIASGGARYSQSGLVAKTEFSEDGRSHSIANKIIFQASVAVPKDFIKKNRVVVQLSSDPSDPGPIFYSKPVGITLSTNSPKEVASMTRQREEQAKKTAGMQKLATLDQHRKLAEMKRRAQSTGEAAIQKESTTSHYTTLVPLDEEIKKRIAAAKQWVATEAPQSVPTNKKMAGPPYELGELKLQAIQLEAVTSVPVWSADGKSLFICTEQGSVSRISYPGFVETHRLETKAKCGAICVTSSSIVVSLVSVGELLVLSPTDLKVTGKIDYVAAGEISGSTASDLVYCADRNAMNVVDLEELRVVAQSSSKHPTVSGPRVTADGKFVFRADNGRISRYRVNGIHLDHEETSDQMGYSAGHLCVSGDSKHVALPTSRGNRASYPGMPRMDEGTFLFSIDDLSYPKVAVPSNSYPGAIDVDPKSGKIYFMSNDGMLAVLSRSGMQLARFKGIRTRTAHFVVHPLGGSLLMKSRDRLVWVEPPIGPIEKEDGTIDDSDWLKNSAPKPTAISKRLLGRKESVQGASTYRVNLSSESLAGEPVFSSDGKRLYTVSKTGLVQLLEMPEFKSTLQIDLKTKSTDLAITAEGLVVAAPDDRCLYVLDAATLSVKRRILAMPTYELTGCLQSSLAFGISVQNGTHRLASYDLKTGKVIQEKTRNELAEDAVNLRPGIKLQHDPSMLYLKMTPDGKYLLTAYKSIVRYRIDGKNLIFEQATPEFARFPRSMMVSLDGKFTAVPSSQGNRTSDPQFPKLNDCTFVFAVGDLSKPQVAIESGKIPTAIAIDPVSSNIYAQNAEKSLLVFSANGGMEQQFELTEFCKKSKIVPSPLGRRVLVLNENESRWVDFTATQ